MLQIIDALIGAGPESYESRKAIIPNTSKSSLQRIQVWIHPETGRSEICFSCGHRIGDELSFKCNGCSVRIHQTCLSEMRPCIDEDSSFQCGLCWHALLKLNPSLCYQLKSTRASKRPKLSGSESSKFNCRCASCHNNYSLKAVAICRICGFYICHRCAVVGSKLDRSGDVTFDPELVADFTCILCDRKGFEENLTIRLIRHCAEAHVAYEREESPNLAAIHFFVTISEAQNQNLWSITKLFSESFRVLLDKEIEYIEKSETNVPNIHPGTLLDLPVNELSLNTIANANANFYFQAFKKEKEKNSAEIKKASSVNASSGKLQGTCKGGNAQRARRVKTKAASPAKIVQASCVNANRDVPSCTDSSKAQTGRAQDGRELICFVTSDGDGYHPTIYLAQAMIVALSSECNVLVKVHVYLKGGKRVDDTMQFIEAGIGSENVIYRKQSSDPRCFIREMEDSRPDFVIFLDGHTGNLNALWNAWELHVFEGKLPIFLAVWLAYAGVYGQRSFTIACTETVRDPTACGNARIALLPASYHVSSALSDSNLRERDRFHTRESYGLDESDIVLAFPGRLGRVNIESMNVWLQIMKEYPHLKFFANLHYSTLISCLILWEYVEENGVDPSRFLIGQGMDRQHHQQRTMVVADLVVDVISLQGLHTIFSESYSLGKLVITQRGELFRRNVGAAISKGVGLCELVGNNKEEYVDCVRRVIDNLNYRQDLEDKLSIFNLSKTAVFDAKRSAADFLALCRKGQKLMHGQCRFFSVELDKLTSSDGVDDETLITLNSILPKLEDLGELSYALSTKSMYNVLTLLSENYGGMKENMHGKKTSLFVLGSGREHWHWHVLAFAAVTDYFGKCSGLVMPSVLGMAKQKLELSLEMIMASKINLHSECTLIEDKIRDTSKMSQLDSEYFLSTSLLSVILLCAGIDEPVYTRYVQHLARNQRVTKIALIMDERLGTLSGIADDLNGFSAASGGSSFRQNRTFRVNPYSMYGKSMVCHCFIRDTGNTPASAMCNELNGACKTESAAEVVEEGAVCSESYHGPDIPPAKIQDGQLTQFVVAMNVHGLVFADIGSGQLNAIDIAERTGAVRTFEHRSLEFIRQHVLCLSESTRRINFGSIRPLSKLPNLHSILTWVAPNPLSASSLQKNPLLELMCTSQSLFLVGMLVPGTEYQNEIENLLRSNRNPKLAKWRIEKSITLEEQLPCGVGVLGLIIRRHGGEGKCAAREHNPLTEPQSAMPLPSDLTLLLLRSSNLYKPIQHLWTESKQLQKREKLKVNPNFLNLEQFNQASEALFASSPLLNLKGVCDCGGYGLIVQAQYKEESIVLKLAFQSGSLADYYWNHSVWREKRVIHSIGLNGELAHCVPRLINCLFPNSPLGIINFAQGRLAVLAMEQLEPICNILNGIYEYVQLKRRFENDQIRTVVSGLLVGLNALHSKGFGHGDIKPRNILFRKREDDRFEVVLIDFGLSMKIDEIHDFKKQQHSSRSVTVAAAVGMPVPTRLVVPLNNIVTAHGMPTMALLGSMRPGTRGYRQPEALSSSQHILYSDMWQVGILLLQLVWRPANSKQTTLDAYEKDVLTAVSNQNRDFSKFLIVVNRNCNLEQADSTAWDESVLRLLQLAHSCLDPNCEGRCTPAKALLSAFVQTPILPPSLHLTSP
jgi:serine/threonine protein kinase